MEIEGRRVAVLTEEGYQELEFWYPVLRFREEGAHVTIAAPQATAAYESRLGYPVLADAKIADLDPSVLDAVVIPGTEAGRRLTDSKQVAALLAKVRESGGLIAAIGSGVGTVVAAGVLADENSTAEGVVTARTADDLPELFASIRRELETVK